MQTLTLCDEILHQKRLSNESPRTTMTWGRYFLTGEFYDPETGCFFLPPLKLKRSSEEVSRFTKI